MARLPWTAKGFAVRSCPVFNEASVQPRRATTILCDPVETFSPPLLLILYLIGGVEASLCWEFRAIGSWLFNGKWEMENEMFTTASLTRAYSMPQFPHPAHDTAVRRPSPGGEGNGNGSLRSPVALAARESLTDIFHCPFSISHFPYETSPSLPVQAGSPHHNLRDFSGRDGYRVLWPFGGHLKRTCGEPHP